MKATIFIINFLNLLFILTFNLDYCSSQTFINVTNVIPHFFVYLSFNLASYCHPNRLFHLLISLSSFIGFYFNPFLLIFIISNYQQFIPTHSFVFISKRLLLYHLQLFLHHFSYLVHLTKLHPFVSRYFCLNLNSNLISLPRSTFNAFILKNLHSFIYHFINF